MTSSSQYLRLVSPIPMYIYLPSSARSGSSTQPYALGILPSVALSALALQPIPELDENGAKLSGRSTVSCTINPAFS